MRYITCFAKGVDEQLNKKALSILENYGKFTLTKGGYYRFENIAVARYLKKLGFKGKAKTKRIPDYVFGLNDVLRDSFLEGFISADGYINNTLRCTEISNYDLARDIKHLAELGGFKVSNIHSRTRTIQPPHSPEPIIFTGYHISIGNRKRKSKWDWERVKSIKKTGKKEVYDLTVSNTHNFVAEGMVVHNTRWHDRDLYDWILDPDNQIISGFKTMILPAYEGSLEGEDFKALWPGKFTRSHIKALMREKGPYEFSCQYQNDPVPDEDATFQANWFSYYDETELKGRPLNKYILIDPAISQEKEADYTAMVVLGIDHFGYWYILDLFREHVNPNQLIQQIFYLNERWHPLDIAIEEVAFQKALQYSISDEMRRRNEYLPISEVKPQERSKEQRIKGLQPLYANGIIFHNKDLRENDYLEDELLRFPRGRHDDLVDALSYGKDIVAIPRRKRSPNRGNYVSYSPYV
jgi:predicted phage terminase large subunit-like protein